MPAQQTASDSRHRRLHRQASETSDGTGIPALSAVLLGIAAVVIGCAAVLLMMDVHDRIHYEKVVESLRANHPALRNSTEERSSENAFILPLPGQSKCEEQAPMANISTTKKIGWKSQKESVAPSDSKHASDVSKSSSDANVYIEDSADPGAAPGTTFVAGTQERSNEHLVLDFSDLSKLTHTAPLGTTTTDSLSIESESSSSASKVSSITNYSLPCTAVEI